MTIELSQIQKKFDNHIALSDVNLKLHGGQLTSLLGPSGCGKTTLLRIIAGLEQPNGGRVLFDEQDQTLVHPKKRRVGFVFQHYALFKHLTVFENVAFGLRVKPRKIRPSNLEIKHQVQEILGLVQLDNQSAKLPHQMSGGQRQRVALARALVTRPQLLLLDEPFGALDAHVRKDLRRWLRRLHDEIQLTSILVTHDQEEALEVSDTVVLMNQGRIEQVGSPEEIYHSPANPFVYEFLGAVNVLNQRHRDHAIYVRPHEFTVTRRREYVSDYEGIIRRISYVGPEVRLEISVIQDTEAFYEIHLNRREFKDLELSTGNTLYFRPNSFSSFQGEGI